MTTFLVLLAVASIVLFVVFRRGGGAASARAPDPDPVDSASASPTPSTAPERVDVPAPGADDRDWVERYVFRATLRVDTPLEVLERHGEVWSGGAPPGEGDGAHQHGWWVPEIRWESMGVHGSDDGTMWSPVGAIPRDGGVYLPFLKSFRRIVEGPGSTDEKVEAVDELLDWDPRYERIRTEFGDDFPESWFARELTAVRGVDEDTALALFRGGFYTPADLDRAGDEHLLAIEGVGRDVVDDIRAHFEARAGDAAVGEGGEGGVAGGSVDDAHLREREITELFGLIKSVLADGVVTEEEVDLVRDWARDHEELRNTWPVRPIADRIERVFADGVVDDEEREDLLELFQRVVGGRAPVVGLETSATDLPFTQPKPGIDFANRVFVLTGRFASGPRHECERMIERNGGICADDVTSATDYVVVGTFGNHEWGQSSWGKEIGDAVALRERGLAISIVSESHWAGALP